MPVTSDHTEPIERAVIESQMSPVTGKRHAQEQPGTPVAHSVATTCSTPLEFRIRLLSLGTVLQLLERERDGLQRELAECERALQSREAEIHTLEKTLERKELILQQRSENYERIIEAKHRAYRDLAERNATQSTRCPRCSSAAGSLWAKTIELFERNDPR